MRWVRWIVLGFALVTSLEAGNPILFMVSPPRSLSTAFTRMMYERGDCAIYHEPLYHPYCLALFPDYAKETYRSDAYTSLEQVKSEIFSAAEKRMVFVKEISNAVEEVLLSDLGFIKNPQVQFVFLLRNPHHTALSFYKKCPEQTHALKEFMGFEALYKVYCRMESLIDRSLPIILSEDLCDHPEETVQAFCETMHISYIPEALHWKQLDDQFDVAKEWHEYKLEGPVEIWHGNAISSSGFGRVSQYAVDEFGEPTFEEVEDLEDRELVREAYLYNLHFYHLLKEKMRS